MRSVGSFAGRVGVVTGGTSGIGRAIALRLAAEGAADAVAAPDDNGMETITGDAHGDRIVYIRADVRIPDDVERLIAETERQLGRVSFLFANAGVAALATATETTEETWAEVIETNLGGAFRLAKHGIPALVRAGGGSIVLTASDLGLVGARSAVAYCASKGGVVNLTRALALDCAPLGIRVNCICPGSVQTPMLERWYDGDQEGRLELDDLVPLGRVGTPREIADIAVLLASPAASYMTGSIVSVDGGVTAWYGV